MFTSKTSYWRFTTWKAEKSYACNMDVSQVVKLEPDLPFIDSEKANAIPKTSLNSLRGLGICVKDGRSKHTEHKWRELS